MNQLIANIFEYVIEYFIVFRIFAKTKEVMEESVQKRLLVEKVADVVCNHYGVDVNDIFSLTRRRPVSLAREATIHILHCDYKMSLSYLANMFERTTRWICDICSTKKLHIDLYDDCMEEHDTLLLLIEKELSL